MAKPEITRSGMGHPLSGTRETWLAPNVHLPGELSHNPDLCSLGPPAQPVELGKIPRPW